MPSMLNSKAKVHSGDASMMVCPRVLSEFNGACTTSRRSAPLRVKFSICMLVLWSTGEEFEAKWMLQNSNVFSPM